MNINKIFWNWGKIQKKSGGVPLNTCILATEGPKESKLKSNDCYDNVVLPNDLIYKASKYFCCMGINEIF